MHISNASERTHDRELLAGSTHALVERCACGTLHVSVGPLSFRVRADVAEDLWSTLGSALATLAARESEVPRLFGASA